MLQSLIDNNDAIKRVKLNDEYLDGSLDTLNNQEMKECANIARLLQPYEQCSKIMAGKILKI